MLNVPSRIHANIKRQRYRFIITHIIILNFLKSDKYTQIMLNRSITTEEESKESKNLASLVQCFSLLLSRNAHINGSYGDEETTVSYDIGRSGKNNNIPDK